MSPSVAGMRETDCCCVRAQERVQLRVHVPEVPDGRPSVNPGVPPGGLPAVEDSEQGPARPSTTPPRPRESCVFSCECSVSSRGRDVAGAPGRHENEHRSILLNWPSESYPGINARRPWVWRLPPFACAASIRLAEAGTRCRGFGGSTLSNSVRLSYAFRTGALTGVAAGRLVHMLAHCTPDRIAAWEKQQEMRTGHWNPYDHTFIPPGGPGALGRVLRLSKATGSTAVGRSFTGSCPAAGLDTRSSWTTAPAGASCTAGRPVCALDASSCRTDSAKW